MPGRVRATNSSGPNGASLKHSGYCPFPTKANTILRDESVRTSYVRRTSGESEKRHPNRTVQQIARFRLFSPRNLRERRKVCPQLQGRPESLSSFAIAPTCFSQIRLQLFFQPLRGTCGGPLIPPC